MSDFRFSMRAVLELGRVSNLPTVWTNVLAAWFLAGATVAHDLSLAWLLAGATLLYMGGTTLNDFFDVTFDRTFRSERPIPRGAISWKAVGRLGFGCLGFGSLLMLIGGAAWYWIVGLNAMILLYDWQHKRWVSSVIVMGACRLLLVVAVASSVDESVRVWLYGVSLMAYIVGLSYTARGESRKEAFRGWTLALLAVPLPVSWFLVPSWTLASPWILFPALLFIILVTRGLRYLRKKEDPTRVGRCVALLLAGITILDAMMFMSVSEWGWAAILMFPVALLLQRVVPAT